MGQESRKVKKRFCPICKEGNWASAQELIDHSLLCKRVKEIGLILPNLITPNSGIIMP